jgi:hypothetical protein
MKKHLALSAVLLLLATILSCANQISMPSVNPPGFWYGFLHGFISPVSFIVSLFTEHRLYAFPNVGRWYDFGFMLGIGGFSGGIFRSSRKRR